MKKLLLIALILITNFVSAQTQLSDYYDASVSNRPDFSYNVTIQIQKNAGETNDAKKYTATLIKASPDSKGYYNTGPLGDNKFYNCSQLGSVCNPNNFRLLGVKIYYSCNGQEKVTSISFRGLNTTEYIPTVLGAGGKFCESIDFNSIEVRSVIPTNEGQIIDKIKQLNSPATNQNKSNTSPQNTNTGNQSNTNNSIGQIPNSYTGNPLHYNNPNVSSGSSAVDSYNKGVQQGQQIMDAITPIGNAIVDAYNRKVERENNKIPAAKEIKKKKKKDYQIFVQNLNTKISDTNYFYQNVIQKIPNLLSTNSPSWEWLLNSKELPLAFGKNSEYIISTYNDISQTTTKNSRRKDLELENGNYYTYLYTFGCFTGDDSFKYDYNLNGVNHPYKWGFQGTGIRHESKFIYNEYNIVIGVFLKLLTYYDRYSPSSSFSFEEYYKDLLNKVGANYLLLDANTILLKDKLIIITYDGIEMYDLNLLKDQYFVNFNKYINSPSFKRLGIGFKQLSVKSVPQYENKERKYKSYYTDEKGVIIGSLLTNGLAEKSGLKVDDIISNINGISVTSPYILQLIVQVPTIDNKLKIIYLRNGIEYKTTINI